MARQTRNRRDRFNPYLSTEDVMNLTGATRRLLTTVENRGICKPHRYENGSGTLGWTPNQVQFIGRVCQMRTSGMSFEQIQEAVEKGAEEFERTALAAQMSVVRSSRRSMKREAHMRRALMDVSALRNREGFYLRYIPERYFGVIAQDMDALLRPADYTRTLMALTDVATHVGWVPSGTSGLVVGAPTPQDMTCFAYTELVSMPLPAPLVEGDADSGCYHDFGGSCAYGNEGRACELCARYGRPVTSGDQVAWSDFSGTYPMEDRTVMLAELERAYPCGPWSEYADAHAKRGRGEGKPSVAAKPRLMPHVVRLPMGVTAMVMPAGWYLCRQCSSERLDKTLSEMVGALRVISHRDMTVAEELERAQELQRLTGAGKGFGFAYADVQSAYDPVADPMQLSQWRPLEDMHLSSLKVLTNIGVSPDSDYDVICSTFPSSGVEDLPGYELQVLVDESGLDAMIDAERKSRGFGIVSAIMRPFEKERLITGFRCRACYSKLDFEPGRGVCVCGRCGKAQSVPVADGGRCAELLRQADEARHEGRYAMAEQLCDLACKLDPRDANARWLKVLCHYGIEYVEDPMSGRRLAVANCPDEVSVYENEDYRMALSAANDSQWEVFKRHGYSLERARQDALGLSDYRNSISARWFDSDSGSSVAG